LTDASVIVGNTAAASHLCALAGLNSEQATVAFGGVSVGIIPLGIAPLYAAMTTLAAYSEGVYGPQLSTLRAQSWRIFKVVFWVTLLIATDMAMCGDSVSVCVLCSALPLNALTLIAWRACGHRTGSAASRNIRNILIVGTGRTARAVSSYLHEIRGANCVVRGFLVEAGPIGGPVLGTVENLARIAREQFADEVILTSTGNRKLERTIIKEARQNRLDVRVIPDLLGFLPSSRTVEFIGDLPVLTIHEESVPQGGLLLKRALDVFAAIVGLALVSPLLAIIGIAIRIESPGPVFYRGSRVGRKAALFTCWKFRTMVADADRRKDELRASNQRQGPFFKMFDDPRITRLGRFLRRYSLDELPQLWNVLKGEMSLVGPRPHPIDDFRGYQLSHLRRLDMIPGLTGLWQVTARAESSFERGMTLDLEYIERWNLWLDFRILWKTLGVVLKGTGA
jgi:exopolysaccharide biosynthesis polyprenyl glycosylphosphotransferase